MLCFLFPPFFHSSWMTQLDDGVQGPDVTFDDDSYKPEGAYYYVEAADDHE